MPEGDVRGLLLAFSWHMAREVVAADGARSADEAAWLHATFPPEVLRAVGLVDERGVETPRFTEWRDRALLELPERLTLGEKLALLEGLLDAVAADGELQPAEVAALAASAAMLGVAEVDWRPLVADLERSGRVR